ncbi:hypothetical protein QNI19_04710 [Cytophagaceae bacterium DM2B3-1]|uniref:DUF4259 domain-containing protein n=1 Tax=Xanthocytophaga flava TaxID=3048013 RepID=A0ABT7CEU3_9BACT|nr:hypothetical protein [Xanthocytophaga flavus]MDJ1469045.1 hypothetical protein [Xanthocytophaga flavus]MDJ1492220.1 hypothetical protein [Xanthocytophaga flavus]
MKEIAHPNALQVLKEDFFWDTSDEFAPFGSDEGSDAFSHFYEWKKEHPDIDAIEYIRELLIKDIGIDSSDLEYIDANSIPEEVRSVIIEEIDFELIAICFGQILLTATIDCETKRLTQIVIKRQLSNYVLEYWSYGDLHLIEQQKRILQKELEVLENL